MSALAEHEAYHTSDAQQHDWYGQPDAPRRTRLLDKPSDPHPILNQLMDEALTRILLVSDGAVMALKERTTGSKAGTIEPTSWLASVVHELDTRYEKCKTHRARLDVIKDAQATLDKLRRAPRRAINGDDEWKQRIINDPRSCRVLAEAFGVGKSTIARIKQEAATVPAVTVTQMGKRHSLKDREKVNKKWAKEQADALTKAVEEITIIV